MRLTLSTLPKLAVSAKLLCLLMVVICGAVPSMVRSVRLFNDCSSSDVRIDMRGRVLADDDIQSPESLRNLTIRSLDFSVKLTIFAEESKRFLCFNHRWKLVGSKRFRGPMCQFYEDMDIGYNRFRSVADETKYMGFNRRGRPQRATSTSQNSKCIRFVKRDQQKKFDIKKHNYWKNTGNSGTYNESTDPDQRRIKNSERRTTPRIRHKNHHRKFVNYP